MKKKSAGDSKMIKEEAYASTKQTEDLKEVLGRRRRRERNRPMNLLREIKAMEQGDSRAKCR